MPASKKKQNKTKRSTIAHAIHLCNKCDAFFVHKLQINVLQDAIFALAAAAAVAAGA